MLFKIYDDVVFLPKFEDVSVELKSYEGKQFYNSLERIYNSLMDYEGCEDFIRKKTLFDSDLYIPSEKILIETDELQHFSEARLVALNKYPEGFECEYNFKAYKRMCEKVNSKGLSRKKRNVQRAWYDTIRDFLPVICPDKVKNVVRIPLGGYKWCDLSHKKKFDIAAFKRLLKSDDIWLK
jgi:hypothetical protein